MRLDRDHMAPALAYRDAPNKHRKNRSRRHDVAARPGLPTVADDERPMEERLYDVAWGISERVNLLSHRICRGGY